MTALLVLAVWFGLACLTWALFAAVVRGNGMAHEEAVSRPEVELPNPRIPQQPRADVLH